MIKNIKNIYSKKIITSSKLFKIIGKRPRKKKVVLCHGNFDVVHPGHIRHLLYGKSKGDLLVVSITADKFIKKGIYRPFVPEDLRALNLAAFQMVDYVVIDNNEKPLKNLNLLKPDFFAKGFEYKSSGLPKATKEEAKIVESYGGEMIFTPGDIVYSSTALLNLSEPNIENLKLIDLMNKNKITFKDLRKSLEKIKKIRVHVIGDTIIDTYTKTNLIGGHVKTPTPSVLYQEKKDYIGGAGIVARHLESAGANVTFTTVLGNDELKEFVLKELKNSKIKLNAIIDKTRPTTNKNTIVANGYKLLKIDKLENVSISLKILKRINSYIKGEKTDIIIFSDFRHGIFNKSNINSFISSIGKNIFKVADSQVATRWGNITDFKDFDLITPNEREVRFSLADQDSNISVLTQNLASLTNYKNLLLKLGERGLFAVSNINRQKPMDAESFTIPTFVNKVEDSVGAGDTLLAYATLSMMATNSLMIASIIGSMGAACQCENLGNITVSPQQILEKINAVEKTISYKKK
ncbi:PfkB family carbohydrate kinase [Candidatus Pelagibacter sp.]|nr:PfkB family carbohydrate kinase [Candidatus Pelagibacter sp.]